MNFKFAQILQMKRQQLNLTQEDIANFVGVTRAAVSKWEKGLSYPDITLLPKLATYFNLSIDTLLGYEPQMTKEKIEQLYAQFALRLGNEPFENVEVDMKIVVKEYFSCFPLLLRIIQLYINYYRNAKEPESTLQSAMEIVEHIKTNSTDISINNEAIILEACLYLIKGEAKNVLEILGTAPKIELGSDQLIATAHSMLGNLEMAKEVLQVSMYQQLLGLISNGTEALMLETDNEPQYSETVRRVEQVMGLFQVDELQVNSALVFYLKAANGYIIMNKYEAALSMIEKYVNTCEKLKFPMELHGDAYFYKLKNWINKQPQISVQAPRDEQSIKKDVFYGISINPNFSVLQEDEQFKTYVKKLKTILQLKEEE